MIVNLQDLTFRQWCCEDSSLVVCDFMVLGSSTVFLQNIRHYLPIDAAPLLEDLNDWWEMSR